MLTPPRVRACLALVGWTRIAFGVAFVITPARAAAPWIGAPARTTGGRMMTRSMGIRDGLLGVGLLSALRRNDGRAAAGWLASGASAGVVDAASTIASWRHLSRTAR